MKAWGIAGIMFVYFALCAVAGGHQEHKKADKGGSSRDKSTLDEFSNLEKTIKQIEITQAAVNQSLREFFQNSCVTIFRELSTDERESLPHARLVAQLRNIARRHSEAMKTLQMSDQQGQTRGLAQEYQQLMEQLVAIERGQRQVLEFMRCNYPNPLMDLFRELNERQKEHR